MSIRAIFTNERGSIGLYGALVIGMFLAIAAFAIDIGYAIVSKQELRNVADSVALAGARVLGELYEGLPLDEQRNFVLNTSQKNLVLAAMDDLAQKNSAGGLFISVDHSDIQFGQWDGAAFFMTNLQPTAVAVTVRRDRIANGPLSTSFAGVFGVDSMAVAAQATAALLPIATAVSGEVDIPVGISKEYFELGGCGDTIEFHPTGSLVGCAGWHTFEQSPANASKLKDILIELRNGTFAAPEVIAEESQFIFIGGNVASAFSELENLYDTKKDASGNWETFLVVYDQSDCNNPHGPMTIVGFAKATIYSVQGPPNMRILAKIECDGIHKGRPGSNAGNGGQGYGTKSSVPGLVL
ncbi:MAG: pilus assembly protein [Nitrospirales bacterium]|nr:pilus assembly protein [Nitrospira sp.]MDR4501780.1 pilus assembly protein [Nitrospirales bacterium]